MKKKREEALKVAQEKAEQEQTERATKRRDTEKFSIKQQMKVCLGFVDSISIRMNVGNHTHLSAILVSVTVK